MPDLLRTAAYARALLTRVRPEWAPPATEKLISVQIQRQEADHGAEAAAAMGDHRRVGAAPAHRRPPSAEGAARVHAPAVEAATLTIQIVPNQLSGCAAQSRFQILRFADPDLPDVVYIEHLGGAVMVDGIEKIEIFNRALDHLAIDAETRDRSRQVLARDVADL